MNAHRISIVLAALFLPVILCAQPAPTLTPEQSSWLERANRHERNGWTYLHVEGPAKARGFQHGYLLAKDIREGLRILGEAWHYQSALDWSWLVTKAGAILTAKVDSENLGEIDGIVDGMRSAGEATTRDEIVALNGYMELMWYWWPSVKESIAVNAPES